MIRASFFLLITQGRCPCTPQGDSAPLTPYQKTDNVIVHVKLKTIIKICWKKWGQNKEER